MTRLSVLSTAIVLLASTSFAEPTTDVNEADIRAQREAILRRRGEDSRSHSASLSASDSAEQMPRRRRSTSSSLPEGYEPGRKGPFHPKPSKKYEERMAAKQLKKSLSLEANRQEREARLEEHRKRMRELGYFDENNLAKIPPIPHPLAPEAGNKDASPSAAAESGSKYEEELITDPERRAVLVERLEEQHRRNTGEGIDHRNGDARQHYFAALMTEPAPGPEAPQADRDAHQMLMNRRRAHFFNSHPRNVMPTAPNFGLRYRVTHLATMGFSILGGNDGTDMNADPIEMGNVTIALFGKSVPKTVENFVGLCNDVNGFGYVGSRIHRIIPNFIIQGGDIEGSADGEGGHTMHALEEDDMAEMAAVRAAMNGEAKSESRSIPLDHPSDAYVKGEQKRLQGEGDGSSIASASQSNSKSRSLSPSSSNGRRTKNRYMKHENYLIPHGAGTISMAASHRSKVGSQFYFALDDAQSQHLNKRFVAFGHIVFGYRDTISSLTKLRLVADDKPLRPIIITSCSALPYNVSDEELLSHTGLRAKRSRMLRDDHYSEDKMKEFHEEAKRMIEMDTLRESQSLADPPQAEGSDGDLPQKRSAREAFLEEQRLLAKGPVRRAEDGGASAVGKKNPFASLSGGGEEKMIEERLRQFHENRLKGGVDGGAAFNKAQRAELYRKRREALRKQKEEALSKQANDARQSL